jgi:hypothetical protein
MYLEYDWTSMVFRLRLGEVWTDLDGVRSFDSLQEVRAALGRKGLKLGRKTDTRTWEVVSR